MSFRKSSVRALPPGGLAWAGSLLVTVAAACGGGAGSAAGGGFQDSGVVEASKPDTASKQDSNITLKSPDATSGCGLVTCQSANANCGPIGDGCGQTIDCGTCKSPETCGGGGTNRCGVSEASTCKATTCAKQGFNCGPQGDGCGGVLHCGTCKSPASCGGGGKAGVCGSSDGGAPCTPGTCASLNANCGTQSDGCGSSIDCGTCTPPAYCGGGGQNQCGVPEGGTCIPLTCGSLGFNCGPAGDGCGGTIDCGTCSGAQTCGGGGVSGQCGSPSCTPLTCSGQGANCGPMGDGCGDILDCGTCVSPDVCGGGGTANVCGSKPCVPTDCATLGLTCGPASDGCGSELQCGSCSAPQACGGAGTPGVCGCTGSCAELPSCTGGTTTTLSGNVYDPADLHPLYNVVVYIPNDTSDPTLTSPFAAGVTCDQCGGATAAGDPLVSTTTAVDGSFTLSGIPVGSSIPLVIQTGRWRRQFTVRVTNGCGANPVSSGNTTPSPWGSGASGSLPSDGHLTMPANSSQGDIPRIAILSGSFDMVECELRKIGIDDSEFVNPGTWGQGGHVQFYTAADNGSPGYSYYGEAGQWGSGAIIGGGSPAQSQLFGNDTASGYLNIDQYDLVILECEGYPQDESSYLGALASYTNAGGRVFSSDFAYTWLYQNSAGGFENVANWATSQDPQGTTETAVIDTTSNPVAGPFQQWLEQSTVAVPGASGGSFSLDPVFTNSNGVQGATQQWLYGSYGGTNHPIHFTFNTPVGATSTCGRVTFSDWHTQSGLIGRENPNCYYDWWYGGEVCPSDGWTNYTFPAECEQAGFPTAMTDQETILEFMLFDLTACVPQYQASCVPLSCTQQGISCGPAGDGCGSLIQCGDCTAPATCGGGGTHGVCGTPSCIPGTCTSEGFDCGEQGDGCGGTLSCGTCTPPEDCGGGGTPGQCGGLACVQKTCAEQGISCGPAGDGCGGVVQCGNCASPQTCGGGGKPGMCGTGSSCTPTTCVALNYNCGPAGDGCGGVLQCGNCAAPQTCGGGGKAGMCGSPSCSPTTCAALGYNCGPAGNGCGGLLQCGTCTSPATCGGGGKAGVCGTASCVPETCASQEFNCGEAGDGCGGTISCGACTSPDTCGGGGQANRCGTQK